MALGAQRLALGKIETANHCGRTNHKIPADVAGILWS